MGVSRSNEGPRNRGERGRLGSRSVRPDVHLNLNVRGMTPSATLAIQERCAALRAAHKNVYRLGLGQSPFPVPRPVVEELEANARQKDYLAVKGLPALREAVSEYHHRSQGLPCTAEDVLIGPGSKELMFLLQMVYYGDIIIPSPAWVSYAPQAKIVGRQIGWVHTERGRGWKIGPGDISAVCGGDPSRPRVLVMNYPSNPTGLTYTSDELREIARVARNYRVVVLSDEIYGEVHHKGQHVSIARFYPEGTIVSGGLSKWCGAGGWRLGTFTFPASMSWLLDAMAAVASETFTSTSAPIQYAAVRAFQGGMRIERYLWNSRRILGALGRWCARTLRENGVDVDLPTGGFYLFPDLSPMRESLAARGIHTSRDLCERVLEETGVATLPGEEFGRPPVELTLRMAYVDFDGARALAALEVLPRDEPVREEFLRVHCERTMVAVEAFCEWLRQGPKGA